ncbi:PucR family transcriptional regulator [Paenibacillus caui]|uniref:PucR family transcriptional regulator n=1 Tax=Paenibacillus caui TaxID=2873927 RepID=UPI001CA7FD86|nr:PucR family transcriptional regulator [Paenibacillus caui]
MRLTIEEALRIYPLSRSRIAAGASGSGRVIKSVNIMDAPDISDWVKEGEMLFTTAFAIKDTPEDFVHLIQILSNRKAAGLGIKLGRYWKEIPDIAIEEANRLHFPLIELPYEFTFADQMNALVQAEIERSTKKLHDALDKQKRLMRFAIEPGETSSFFERIGEILAHPMVVIGSQGQILHSTCDWPESEVLRDWPWATKFDKTRTLSGWRCSVPLLQEGECCGFLVIMPVHTSAIQEEEGLFHQAAEIISFHMDRFQDERQSVAGYQWTLILERYLQRKISPEQFMEQTRTVLKDDYQGAVHLCVTTSLMPGLQKPPTLQGLRKIRRELLYHPYLSNIDSHHLVLENEMVSLFALRADKLAVSTLIQHIVEAFGEVLHNLPDSGFHSYVSNPKLKLIHVLEAYEECRHAARISENLPVEPAPTVILFSDLELSFLFRHIPRKALADYSNNLFLPLLEKDPEYAGEMFTTLEAYILNEGNINDTARQLFLHRNTVLYRLEKVGELLDIDFKKISDLLQLKLALLFRQILETDSKTQRLRHG